MEGKQRTDWNEVRLPGKLPDRRSNHCSFVLNDFLYIHGGRDIKEGPMSDMWRLSCSGIEELMNDAEYGVSWEQVQCKGTIPGKISHHQPAVFGHSVVVYGGIINSEQNVNDAFEFDSNKNFWSKMKQTGDVPKPRDDHAQCQISDSEFVIFGGFVEGSRTNEAYHCKKTGSTLEWKRIGEGCEEMPKERASHSMAHCEGKCYIYGGQDDDNNKLNDIWELCCESGQFKCLELGGASYEPTGRSGHSANVFNGKMYIFGGIYELAHEINEMMVFDPRDNTWALIEGETKKDLSPTKTEDASPSLKKKMTMKREGTLNSTQGKAQLEKQLTAKKEEKKDEKKESGLVSPTSISMQNSFIIQNADESFDAYYVSMKKRKHGHAAGLDSTTPGLAGGSPGEGVGATFGIVPGIQPDAREGHSCIVGADGYMFAFGGDRHHMPYNDMYLYYLTS